ncbi:C40 family peptidase [Flavobacterium kingsejongi]|nr:C40 family peptidase [Flavobacterium kingsejongi]
MIKKIVILILVTGCIISCRPKKDYIITDEYANKELGALKNPNSKHVYNKVLSEEDRAYFAKTLNVAPAEITNEKLYNFIRSWEGTVYVYGGETRQGIDCSALIRELYVYVYNTKLPRTADEMSTDPRMELFKSPDNLREGDLVFFRISDEKIISHVGIYLRNNKFFAANQYGGVEIVSLKKAYWKKNFIAAGRFQQ